MFSQLESQHQSARMLAMSSPQTPKRKNGLEIINTIFRKRFRESNNKENSQNSLTYCCSNDTGEHVSEVLMSTGEQPTDSLLSLQLTSPYNLIPNCPVSPRVKNIREDMDALMMSRQDNPFISQQLELLSSSGDPETRTVSPITFVTQSSHDDDEASQSLLTIHDLDELEQLDQENLHEHMIRSPPPQFPQKISHFVFPGPGSPVSIRTAVVQSKGRPPILKAASESAAMSVSFHSKMESTSSAGDSMDFGRDRIRRASASGQIMDTSQSMMAECTGQPASSLTSCHAKKFQSMNLPYVSNSPMRTSHSHVGNRGNDSSTDMDSESQEALIPNLN